MIKAIHWKLSKCKIFQLFKYVKFSSVYSEFRYDQRMDAWRDGPPMNAPRYDFAFVSDEARLFAIGGYDNRYVLFSLTYFV